MSLRPEEISSVIKEQIKGFSAKLDIAEVGTVIQVGDGIARVFGLENAMSGELLEFVSAGVFGMTLNLEEDNVGVVLFGNDEAIKEGDTVRLTGRLASVPVGDAMLGRVVNALGEPIDDKGPILAAAHRPIHRTSEYRKFADGYLDKIEKLKRQMPNLNFTEETELLKKIREPHA